MKPRFTVAELRALLKSDKCDHEFRGHGLDEFEIERFLDWLDKQPNDDTPEGFTARPSMHGTTYYSCNICHKTFYRGECAGHVHGGESL